MKQKKLHPDAAGAFVLFLDYSKAMEQRDQSAEDEVGQKEDEEEKGNDEEDDEDEANQEDNVIFEAEEEDDDLSKVSIFVAMRGNFT